jgi:hypothetical protein
MRGPVARPASTREQLTKSVSTKDFGRRRCAAGTSPAFFHAATASAPPLVEETATKSVKRLRNGWFESLADEAALGIAGVYEWRIDEVGLYVGKSKRLAAKLREYPNNVRKLLAGRPYRKSKPDDFRAVHRNLADAHEWSLSIRFAILETCEIEVLNGRERAWIKRRREEEAAGGPPVLNGP